MPEEKNNDDKQTTDEQSSAPIQEDMASLNDEKSASKEINDEIPIEGLEPDNTDNEDKKDMDKKEIFEAKMGIHGHHKTLKITNLIKNDKDETVGYISTGKPASTSNVQGHTELYKNMLETEGN